MFTKILNLPAGKLADRSLELPKKIELVCKKTLKLAAIASISLSITAGTALADVQKVPDAELTMDKNLSYDLHSTLYWLRFGHYSPKELDDDYSSRIFDAYIKVLDPNKVYFTQQDMDGT